MAFQEWEKTALVNQQNFAYSLGNRTWEKYSIPDQEEYLWKKIAFAIAGPPTSEDSSKKYGYTADQQEKINDLKEKCIDYCKKQDWNDVYVAFLFVCAYKSEKEQTTVPLIKVKFGDGKKAKCSYFFDHCGRFYNGWDNFLNENIFDGWWICVPTDAEYSFTEQNEVDVKFYDQTSRGEVLRAVDKVSTITNIATSVTMTAGLIMTFFPPTAPIGVATVWSSTLVGAPGAVYGTGRSIGTLVDRSRHEQSINPFSSGEARACWLTTAASALSVGTMASTKMLTSTAKAGALAGAGTRAFCTALSVTAMSVSGIGIANSVYELSKKDEVTGLDILQLSTSIFFFTHSAVNFKTASTIIKEAQNETIMAHRETLKSDDQKAVFDQMRQAKQEMVEPGKLREMHGNKDFILELKVIENKQEFFSHFQLVQNQQVSVNGELVIHPKAFLQMTLEERTIILKNSNDLSNGKITIEQFNKNVSGIRKEYRIHFETERINAVNKMENVFKNTLNVDSMTDVKVGGKNVFENMQPHEIDRMNQVFTQAGKNYDPTRIQVGMEMANQSGCTSVTEVAAAVEYYNRQLDNKVSALRKQNPNPSRPPGMKAKDFYFKQVAKEFLNNPQVRETAVNDFQTLRRNCDAVNTGHPRFGNSFAAANHYDKHPHFPKIDPNNNISPKRYFEIATEMCGSPMKNPKWTQDGSSLTCKFTSEKYGAVAVRFDNLSNGTSVIATLMTDDLATPIGDPRLHTNDDNTD